MSASLVTIGALAVQTISIIQQTHELCSSIRDTPRNLRILLEELRLLSTLLSGFKDDVSQSTSSAGREFPTALEYCKHALQSIQAFSTDLDDSIQKAKRGLRHWASFKVTFSEKKLRSYLNRLERAKSMLSLAHQCCMHLRSCESIESCKQFEEKSANSGFNLDKTGTQKRKNVSRKDVSRYNLVFGVLSISWSESTYPEPRSKTGWEGANTKELTLQPNSNWYFQRGFSFLYEHSLGAWHTPLQVAAKCSGSIIVRDRDASDLRLLSNDTENINSKPKRTSEDYLNTLRALVENGGDPMVANFRGDTSLHIHTGAINQFRYLLQQESCIIETSQRDYCGDTIAERHARWYWDEGPERARLAWEHENAQKADFFSYGSGRPPPFPFTSKAFLLHETAGHLRHFVTWNPRDLQSAEYLIRKLIAEDVDVHDVSDEDPEIPRTPLAQIPRITGEVDTTPEGIERESKTAKLAIASWLEALRRAKMDLNAYVREEKEFLRSSGTGNIWQPYCLDDRLQYYVDWEFSVGSDDLPCPVSVQYVFRETPEQPEDVRPAEPVELGIPGAWVEEVN
ncbi:MAG: hypothetical protein Q9170_003120 [Blastenia crenularia]